MTITIRIHQSHDADHPEVPVDIGAVTTALAGVLGMRTDALHVHTSTSHFTRAERAALLEAARDTLQSEELEFDDGACFSPGGEAGTWVQGWAWLPYIHAAEVGGAARFERELRGAGASVLRTSGNDSGTFELLAWHGTHIVGISGDSSGYEIGPLDDADAVLGHVTLAHANGLALSDLTWTFDDATHRCTPQDAAAHAAHALQLPITAP